MVVLELDDSYKYVEKRLGDLKSKTPKVIAKSINDTATWARQEMAKEAKKTYTVKTSKGFNGSMTIKKANYGSLEAIIGSKGKTIPLAHYTHANRKKSGTKVKVLNSSVLKTLIFNGKKAFFNKIGWNSGHTGVAQRTGEKMKKNPKKEAIKELFGPSIPSMLGNERRVYGIVEPKINDYLQKQIDRHIEKVLGGYE